jgi:hypothetical protein
VDLDQGLVHVHRRPEAYAYLDVQRHEMPASLAPESVDLPPFDFGALRSTDTKGQPH